MQTNTIVKLVIFAVLAVFVGLPVLFGSWYTVDQGERVVVTRNGAVVDEAGPGLHFKTPFVDSVQSFTVRTSKTSWEKISGHTSDQQQIIDISAALNYHLDPGQVREIYSQLGTHYKDTKLDSVFLSEIGIQLGKFTAQELTSRRDDVAAQIAEQTRVQMTPYHIIVESVQLGAPTFNKSFEDNITALISQETAVRTQKQALEAAKVTADIARTSAQGTADARVISASAEAKAIDLQSAALRASPEYVRLKAVEKWDGKTPTQMVPGSAVPFVNLKD